MGSILEGQSRAIENRSEIRTMKRVLVLVLSNLKHDARVRRQIFAIKDNYKTTVVCFGGDASPDYDLKVIKPTNLTFFRKAVASIFLLLRFHSIAHRILHDYSGVIKTFPDPRFDLIIANDVETLPLAFQFPGKPKVIFNAHEYAPRHFEDKKMWRIFFSGFQYLALQKIYS